jgi:predicted lysophospholipase L1 biosynthesis ABC-type transport system permease subunit
VILVHTVPSVAGRLALNRLVATYEGDVSLPMAPTNLVNFGQDVNFPVILGSVLILFGVAALLHVLVVSVTRRRQEVGLLKSLGLLGHQVASTVLWQTTTVALIGLVGGASAGANLVMASLLRPPDRGHVQPLVVPTCSSAPTTSAGRTIAISTMQAIH